MRPALSVSARWTHDVWLDGAFVRPGEALAPLMSHGLHYGTGVFEGIRFYAGRAFMLEAHMRRLLASGEALGLSLGYSCAALCDAAEALIARSGLADGYLRPLAWFGDEGLGLQAAGLASHTALLVWDWPKVFAPEAGIALALSDAAARPAPQALPPQVKATGGYLVGFLAHRQARAAGFDDSLLLDFEGYIAETSSANFFAVEEGALVTPLADRFLNGITRQLVLSIAQGMGIPVRETHLHPRDVAKFDEAFVTGTAVEITPVTRIGAHRMARGPLTARLQAEYRKRTGA